MKDHVTNKALTSSLQTKTRGGFGGTHNGYFLSHEESNNIALALFSFESLTAYEKYRIDSMDDAECKEVYEYAAKDEMYNQL